MADEEQDKPDVPATEGTQFGGGPVSTDARKRFDMQTVRGLAARRVPIRAAAIVAAACLAVGAAIGAPIAWNVGVRSQASARIAEQTRDNDARYQKYQRLADGAQNKYKKAVDTIKDAENIESSIEDMRSTQDDLKKKVDDARSELKTLTGQVDQAKKNSVSDGVWQVGKDIDAGTYRATGQVGDDCYWEISSGGDIVQNDIPGGGYPELTVSDGQQLKVSSCGVLAKQ